VTTVFIADQLALVLRLPVPSYVLWSIVAAVGARLRFSVIGQLLAAPPAKGTLRSEIEKLAAREWCHPNTGKPVRFGASTIERWFSAE